MLVVMVVMVLAAALGFRNYAQGMSEPTPTLVPSMVAIAPSSTAIVVAAAEETATTTAATLPPTNTRAPSRTNTPRPDQTATGTPALTDEPTVTRTPRPMATPTSLPQLNHTLAITPGNLFIPEGAAPPVPTFAVPLGTTNILLLGSDVPLDEGIGRTDSIIIVAINREGPTASMLSLPRDLWVYIPGWRMNRINTALSHGSSVGYPGGSVKQLTDTILYNFGIPIHYYAQVDFGGFKEGVDAIGGVEVAVSCSLRDWRLKSPELNPNVESNWEIFTLSPGIYDMDGDMALWYARSRRTTSDFDRGRRQQQVLRAMLNTGVDLNLLPQAPEFWATYRDSVKTDMDIGRILQLAALAPAVSENGIQHLYVVGEELQPYIVPSSGAQVQVPVWDKAQDTFRRLFLPPALNQASRPPITVEVINSTDNPDLALLAVDNLERYGFEPTVSNVEVEQQRLTTIEYHAQNLKGSFDWLFSWIVDKRKGDIELVPDTDYEYDYRLVLGKEYDPCRPQLFAPQILLGE